LRILHQGTINILKQIKIHSGKSFISSTLGFHMFRPPPWTLKSNIGKLCVFPLSYPDFNSVALSKRRWIPESSMTSLLDLFLYQVNTPKTLNNLGFKSLLGVNFCLLNILCIYHRHSQHFLEIEDLLQNCRQFF
jgi:hypothetical protein